MFLVFILGENNQRIDIGFRRVVAMSDRTRQEQSLNLGVRLKVLLDILNGLGVKKKNFGKKKKKKKKKKKISSLLLPDLNPFPKQKPQLGAGRCWAFYVGR